MPLKLFIIGSNLSYARYPFFSFFFKKKMTMHTPYSIYSWKHNFDEKMTIDAPYHIYSWNHNCDKKMAIYAPHPIYN